MDVVRLAWVVPGWLVGALLGYAVRRVLAAAASYAAPRPWRGLGPLGIDPPLQLATALAFGLLAWRIEFGLTLAVSSLYAAVLLGLLFVDWRTRYVYDVMVYPALAAALVLTPLASGGVFWQGLAGALLGGAVFGAIYLVGRWLYHGGAPLGLGDVSLAALMGAMLGYERIVSGLLLASVIGAIFALGYVARFRSLKISMPYGPSLCLATLVMLAFA